MRLVRRIVVVEVLAILLLLVAVSVLGRFTMFGLSNLLAEFGMISPGLAGGIPIPTTSMSVRIPNVAVWVGLAGVIGSFVYIMVVSFEAYTSESGGKAKGSSEGAAAKPEPRAKPESGPTSGAPRRPGPAADAS